MVSTHYCKKFAKMWGKGLPYITLNSIKIWPFCFKEKSSSRVFSGKIKFRRNSQGTDSKQSNGHSSPSTGRSSMLVLMLRLLKESGFEKNSPVVHGRVRVRVLELKWLTRSPFQPKWLSRKLCFQLSGIDPVWLHSKSANDVLGFWICWGSPLYLKHKGCYLLQPIDLTFQPPTYLFSSFTS